MGEEGFNRETRFEFTIKKEELLVDLMCLLEKAPTPFLEELLHEVNMDLIL